MFYPYDNLKSEWSHISEVRGIKGTAYTNSLLIYYRFSDDWIVRYSYNTKTIRVYKQLSAQTEKYLGCFPHKHTKNPNPNVPNDVKAFGIAVLYADKQLERVQMMLDQEALSMHDVLR